MTKGLTALCVLTLLAALAAAGTVAPQIFAEVGSAAAPQTVTISVEALQRQVDDVAEFRACEAVEIIRARIAQVRQRLSERRKSRGVLFSLAAGVTVLANGVCGSVIGMPMPELSEALGSAVFGAALSPFFL